MYLLRAITNDKNGDFLTDHWYEFKHITSLVKKLKAIEPDDFQCYNAKEVTDEIDEKMYIYYEALAKEKRREQYEQLKKEFENEPAESKLY
jgi:hypothetical protein